MIWCAQLNSHTRVWPKIHVEPSSNQTNQLIHLRDLNLGFQVHIMKETPFRWLNNIVHCQVQGEKIEKKIWEKILNEIVFYMSVYGRF